MQIEDTIRDHALLMRRVGIPLSGVWLSVPAGETEGALTLSWGLRGDFEPAERRPAVGVTTAVASAPPDTVLAAPVIERDILDAAWRLGAWDICRYYKGPMPRDLDPFEARYGLAVAFGVNQYVIAGQPLLETSIPALRQKDLVRTAARRGSVGYHFKIPAFGNPIFRDRWIRDDATLLPDGFRTDSSPWPPFALDNPAPPWGECYQAVWQFGRRP